MLLNVTCKMKNIAYFFAGNSITRYSFADTGTTNHTKGEIAIIMGSSVGSLLNERVVVCGNDLFVLLLAHYENINCSELIMKTHRKFG